MQVEPADVDPAVALEQQRELERKMAEIQLQIAEARARVPSADLSSIQVVQKENKVADFRKGIATRNPKLTFKLEGSNNYELWRDEALTQTLAIKAKSILKNNENNPPGDFVTDDDRMIWEIKKRDPV